MQQLKTKPIMKKLIELLLSLFQKKVVICECESTMQLLELMYERLGNAKASQIASKFLSLKEQNRILDLEYELLLKT